MTTRSGHIDPKTPSTLPGSYGVPAVSPIRNLYAMWRLQIQDIQLICPRGMNLEVPGTLVLFAGHYLFHPLPSSNAESNVVLYLDNGSRRCLSALPVVVGDQRNCALSCYDT